MNQTTQQQAVKSVIQPFTMSHTEGLEARLKFQLEAGILRLDQLEPTEADYKSAKPAGVQPWSQSTEGMAKLAMFNRLFQPTAQQKENFAKRSDYVHLIHIVTKADGHLHKADWMRAVIKIRRLPPTQLVQIHGLSTREKTDAIPAEQAINEMMAYHQDHLI